MRIINDDLKKANLIKKTIKDRLENNDFLLEDIIGNYENTYGNDLEFFKIKHKFYRVKYKSLIEKNLREALNFFEFDEELNYELANYLFEEKFYYEGLKYIVNSIILNEKNSDIYMGKINEYIKFLDEQEYKEFLKYMELKKVSYIEFPFEKEKSLIGGFFDKEYFCGINDQLFASKSSILQEDIFSQSNFSRYFYKTEILKGKRKKLYGLDVQVDSILPINTEISQNIKIILNNKTFEGFFLKNRWKYLKLNKGDKLKIRGNNPFILGELIKKKIEDKKPKLILTIFVDGLSQKFIEKKSLENLMPNTNKFFDNGLIFNNCYVSGEWTFVGVSSFFTGAYTHNHKIFHPKYNTDNLKRFKVFPEYLKEEGYFNSKIDGDWRSNPSYGYYKGIDRTLYSPSIKLMNSKDVIMEAIENIEAFKEINQSLWICLPDLHDVADEFESQLDIETKESIEEKFIKTTNESSVRQEYSDLKINRYEKAVKRIDMYLGLLYSYLENNFKDEEFVINLISDHGQGYLVKNQQLFLDEERTKIPLMIRGKNIAKGRSDEVIQGLDIYSIILKVLNVKNQELNDAQLPKVLGGEKEREYAFAESIFPNALYRAAIYDKNYKLFLETINNTTDSGQVDLSEYNIKLINKITGKEESEQHKEKLEYYEKEILSKIVGKVN